VLAVLPATALVQTLGIVHSGGDYIHARLLLPAVVAFVAPVAVIPVRRVLIVPVAALAVWGLVAATSLRMEGSVIAGRSLIANGHAVATGATKMANPVTKEQNGFGIERWDHIDTGIWNDTVKVDVAPKPGIRQPLSAMSGVGVGGYTIGDRVYVLDRLGLGDALTARLEVDRPGFIGHEKVLPDAWLAARVTNDDVPPGSFGKGVFGTELYVSPPGRADADADVARRVLRCSSLARLQHAISDPWTVGRAMRNIGESFGLTRLKVPPDPNEALRQLC
jgi:arabinofuranosyltransferase